MKHWIQFRTKCIYILSFLNLLFCNYTYHIVGFSTELCKLILQTNVAQRYKYLQSPQLQSFMYDHIHACSKTHWKHETIVYLLPKIYIRKEEAILDHHSKQQKFYYIRLPNKQQIYLFYLVDFLKNHGRNDFGNINLLWNEVI